MMQQSKPLPLRANVLFFLFSLVVVTLIVSSVNLFEPLGDSDRLYNAALTVAIALIVLLLFFFTRVFALNAQDCAIRAEEHLRHFVLAGRLHDTQLTMRQIIGLRFASDGEFVELAKKAAAENLSEDAIKPEDTYRA